MAITEPLIGKFVNLRCVDISDAKFTLEIRNHSELTKYIPKVEGTITSQENWIEKQRNKENDYFFIIENKKKEPLGTIGCYDIDTMASSCETGRYISIGDSIFNIEAVVLLYDFVFQHQKLDYIKVNVDEHNKKIISLNKKFGADFHTKCNMGEWNSLQGKITKENYFKKRYNIVRILDLIG